MNKPYYFQSLIEKYDPVLILKEDTPQFNAYSRTCSSDTRRQPVILTDAQLNKINKEHKGFLREEDVIKYGSDPKNKFNYICPRYWCLKNNTVIDPAELKEVIGKDGKKELMHPTCGKVLARGDKKVKPGYYIYEFYTKKDGQNRYPGFQTDKHPDGYCLPCCFDKYNTEGRIQAKKECSGETVKDVKEQKVDEKEDEYIKGPEKFPLDPGRWGYLPPEMQSVLREVNADCQISKTNTNLKQNHPCLLRHGVQLNKNQSFIACISDVIFYAKPNVDKSRGTAEILSIKDMRERIIKSLTIDMFIIYQNGNLVTDFKSYTAQVSDQTMKKYNTSDLYKKIKTDEELFYFKTVITAFENFIQFLSDDNAIIDHTYLWDIICMPNRYLFPSGVNLVIFKLPHDDITNNVQLLCPTNHYSTQFYQARKPTIIMIKDGEFYEPIYSYTKNEHKFKVDRYFSEYDTKMSQTMRSVIQEIIKPVLNTLCKPLMSMPTIKMKQSLLPHAIIEKLETYKYIIKKYVMNFNNKIIGIVAEEPSADGITGFIPCYPSVIHDIWENNQEFVFMTDKTLWNNYDDTIKFLTNLYKRSKKKRPTADIPCKPILKVVEDNFMVVGILTETNQFVQLSEPINELDIASSNDIPSLRNKNYIVDSKSKTRPMVNVDVNISTTNDVDTERIDYIQRIKMETNFYNVFRNTIRILLNDYNNIKLREKIELLIKNTFLIYSEKLNKVDTLLKELVNETIQFNGDENYYKLIKDISTCLVKNKEECGKVDNLCAVTRDDNCNLILPEKNLMTHKENKNIYFGKMSDELIRYSRVNQFMFQPQTYLSFGKVQYNLREDEIILLQSLLTQEYFDGLVPVVINKYVTNNSYDEVEPVITQVYDNTFKLPTNTTSLNCKTVLNKISSAIWSKCFPKNFKEMSYSGNVHCTFQIIIDIIERTKKQVKPVSDIQHDLYTEYIIHFKNKHYTKIVDILILEGKKTLGSQVKAQTLMFDDFIHASNYFLTPLDLWLLVNKYQIPTIFISSKNILQTNYAKQTFVAYSTPDFMNDAFVFIVIPGLKNEQVPEFKLIIDESNNYLIPINKLNEECIDKIRHAVDNKQSINEYLDTFIKPKMKSIKRETIDDDDIKPPTFKKMPKKKPLNIMPDDSEKVEDLIAAPTKTRRSNVKLKGRTQTRKLKIIEDNPGV